MAALLSEQGRASPILLTNNKKGFMIQTLDEYCEDFIDFAETAKRPVADLGVAFGYTTKALLGHGIHVIANDLSENHLDELWATVRDEERKRLRLLPGNVLDLDLKPGSLDGILACRWVHFLTGDQLREVLRKFFTWLAPGGRLCITAESVHLGSHKIVFGKYLEAKEKGMEWPGFVSVKDLTTQRKQHMPEKLMLYDTDVFERETKRAGFTIVKCGYIPRPYYPEDLRNDGREAIGIIAEKSRTTSDGV